MSDEQAMSAEWLAFVDKIRGQIARRSPEAAVILLTISIDGNGITTEMAGFRVDDLAKLGAIGHLLQSLEETVPGRLRSDVERLNRLYRKLFTEGRKTHVGRRQ